VTYRSVLANREFAALLASQALSTAGNQLARVAIAVLVFASTDSGFLASATYAVSYLAYLLGGPFLSVLADRYPRLTVMVVCDLLRAPIVMLICLDGIPLWALFACLLAIGLLAPPFDSARSALQPEILSGEAYITGNALTNIVLQLGEVAGFILGGALVATVSVRGALAFDAATFVISAGMLLAWLRQRPAAQPQEARASILVDAKNGLAFVRGSAPLRRYLAFSVIGSAALITPEGLAVPIAHDLHGGSLEAGLLTATVSAGFVVAGVVVARVPFERRVRLLFPLALLAIVPLLLTPLATNAVEVGGLWVVAGFGACLNLIASAAYVQSCPSEYRSRAYGVAMTLLYSTQGLALVAAGTLADWYSAPWAVAVVAAIMLVALLAAPGLRASPASTTQENCGLVRDLTG
jgi:MFS family permease